MNLLQPDFVPSNTTGEFPATDDWLTMYRFNCWNVSLSPAITTLVTGNCLGLKYNLSPDSPSLLQTSIDFGGAYKAVVIKGLHWNW